MSPVMVVTGAGRGIGAAIARGAAQRGFAVAVNYARSASEADAVVQSITAAGGKAVAIQADVSTSEGAAHLFAEVDRQLGRVDVLVNNAGIVGPIAKVSAMPAQELVDAFAINTFSVFYCTGEAVKRMGTSHGGQGGAIINMSSIAARHGGMAGETVYAASKAAVDTLTLGLAKELASEGIRVNAVRPGLIQTTIHAAHGGDETLKKLAPLVPLGRVGTPEEVAETVLWLASPGSSYIHGVLLDVSGGR
ncbi:MAG: SDR family oxidoreductase [Pseudomonadota bacterium]